VWQRGKEHSIGGSSAKRLVWAARIVEGKVASEPRAGVGHGVVLVKIDLFVLDRAPEPLDEDVVPQQPRPSMLIRIA